MDVPPEGGTWWEWLGGIAFIVVSSLFAFTHQRIGEVRSELKEDQVEEIAALRTEIGRLEKVMDFRFQEGKDDRVEMWRIIRENQAIMVSQHVANLDKLTQIPTRDEMLRMMQQLLAARPTQH